MNTSDYILHLAATNFARTWEEAYFDAQWEGRRVFMLPPHYFCSWCRVDWPCPMHI